MIDGQSVSLEAINLTETRLRLGLSRRQAAMAIGVSWDVLKWAEEGKRPSPANQVKIAAFYNVDQIAQWPVDPEPERSAA